MAPLVPLLNPHGNTDLVRSVPGRERELARIEPGCRAARHGAGHLVLLTGEAGIGKSLLAAAVAEHAAGLGMHVSRGWCIDDPGAPTLWPWRRVARDVPGLAAALDAPTGDDIDARLRLAETVAAVLAERAADDGLTVVLEDLHWADSLTLDLLRRLLGELADRPVLLVATARGDGLGGIPLGSALPALVRAANTTHVPLTGLASDAVATWLAGAEQTRQWAGHAAVLVEHTGGNPFYIRSLTEELSSPRQLSADRRPGQDVAAVLAQRPAWRTVLVQPYRALPARAAHTIATAAVLGERLPPTLLAAALDRQVSDVSEDLAAGVTAGLLHFGDTGLAFRHALVRDAIVAGLGPAERAAAHAGIGAALEATGDPLMAGPAAVHWSRVEGPDAAVRCRDLAERATSATVLAPDRGAELAELALESARALGADEGELAGRLLLLTRFSWSAGRLHATLEACARGVNLALAADRPDLAADFALVPQGVGSADVARIVGSLCRRALAALPASEPTRRARLLGVLAVWRAELIGLVPEALAGPAGDVDAAGDIGAALPEELSTAALTAARTSGDPQAELEVIAARHFVLSHPAAIEERAVLAARAVELGPSATTTMGALWGHLWSADLAFQRGDLPGVLPVIADIEGVASRSGSPVAAWHVLRLRGALACVTGDFARARDTAAEALVLAERIGDVSMIGMHHAFHVQLGRLRGDPGDVLPDALEVIHRAPPIPLVRAAVPIILALRGDLVAARAEFETLRHVPERMPLGPRWMGTLSQIGAGAVMVGDTEVARSCHRLFEGCARWCAADGGGSPFAGGSNEFELGCLAQAFGDLELAAGHFERGVAVDDRIGATPSAALGRLGLAEVLESTDPARAREVVVAALRSLEHLDLPGPLARAMALSERLAGAATGGRGRVVAHGIRPGGLSERELEVARLVGQAMTNQQIADRLFLSVRTVESHVRSALAKLDLTTRTEIALWVRGLGDAAEREVGPR